MTFDFFDRRRSAERFAELLDETDGRHHQADEHLAQLVAIGHSLSAARPGVRIDPEFRTGLRAMLVATAERDGIGVTAKDAEEEPEAAVPARRLFGRRIRARGVIVIGVATGAMAVSGISAASENAAPGDAFYPVKRSTERAQLAMAGSDVTKGQLSLAFARNRLGEAVALDGDSGAFRSALDDMDADTRQGVRLLTAAAVARRETSGLDHVDAFVRNQQALLTPALDRVGPANRERAVRSLSLLEGVRERSGAVRTGLACDAVLADPAADELGPLLAACKHGSNDGIGRAARGQATKDAEQPGGSATSGADDDGGSGKSDRREPAATGGPTTTPKSSGSRTSPPPATDDDETTAPATGDDEPTPDSTSEAPAGLVPDEPADAVTDEKDGLIGGILKGIFGE